jgi:hypothetical protein
MTRSMSTLQDMKVQANLQANYLQAHSLPFLHREGQLRQSPSLQVRA